jgi:hypothetical protein
MAPFDARQKSRRAWGFLGENLSETEASRLASVAAEAGVAARVVPAETVPLPDPLPIHWLRAAPEALFYIPGTTETAERKVAWDRVALVAAVPLKETISHVKVVKEGPSGAQRAVGFGLMAVTGLPIGMGKSKEVKKVTQETELFLYLDVFAMGAEGPLRLHVDGQKFNYAVLGEARRPDIMGNFRLLLQSLDRSVAAGARNHGARGMLAGTPLAALGYETAGDYEKELRWLLTPRNA